MNDENERSVASTGSVDAPVAWAVLGKGEIAGHVIGLHDTAMEAHARVGRMVGWGEISTADKVQVVPLYRAPALADAEREAIKDAISCCEDITYGGAADQEAADVLKSLLERLK